MKTCRTCKWWAKPVRLPQFYEGTGVCQSADLITAGINQGMDSQAMLIVTPDPSNTELRTMPDFGCVLHEER